MSARIRVASVVAHMHIGGDENRLLTYCTYRDRARFDHRILVLVEPRDDTETASGPILHRYRQLDVPCDILGVQARSELVRTHPLHVAREVALAMQVVARLALWLRRHRIDIVDARLPLAAMLSALAAPLAGVRAVVGTLYFGDTFENRNWQRIGQLLLPQLHAIVSDSQAALDWYGSWLGARTPRLALVRNGTPTPAPRCSRGEMRARLGIAMDAVVVGQVARLVPYKGQHILLQAAAQLVPRFGTLWFVVCGYFGRNQAYQAELQRLIDQSGIGHRVVITSWPGDIADIWQAVDIHAHASLLDSSPMALHESMALGLPSVVSTAGGIPELVQDGQTGLIVPAGDPLALADALARLVTDPALRQRLGAGAQARYTQRHLPADMARHIEREFALAAGRGLA